MPPSLQIDNTGVTAWENLAAGQKRSAITFGDANAITFGSGDTANAIRLTNIAIPTSNSDAANKQYVDAAIMGLVFKAPVRALALTSGDLTTAYVAGAVVDGVSLVVSPGTPGNGGEPEAHILWRLKE